ncbi:MAG TPA: ABC transporter substrate-binding protein [Thermoanaerobaculia bacterium]|jgi:NitT/TauT family transport system substrate-binding protein|nr:ABC transporter substrate-binding protein [Thermoanaerobaculia bacterium]
MRCLAALIALFTLACGGEKSDSTMRLGYFPNVTHSQALIGVARGDFGRIRPLVFNAGPSVIEALFAGQIDVAYVGPNPAINGYVQSHGTALRIIAGATSGGASLVVRNGVKNLAGRKLASPQLGNTQDVALRNWLAANNIQAEVVPTPNPQILDLFRRGDIDGAWVPEPWASRLVAEAGGVVFLDERTLWPNDDFVTAQVIASTTFLKAHPDRVRRFLEAHVAITRWELAHPMEAKAIVNNEIGRLTGKKLSEPVLAAAWAHMRPTWDPIERSLRQSADAAYAAHFLRDRPNLDGIYDLRLLDEVVKP